MSTTSTKIVAARRKLRARRQFRAFQRAYDQASPAMQSELLAISQSQRNIWR